MDTNTKQSAQESAKETTKLANDSNTDSDSNHGKTSSSSQDPAGTTSSTASATRATGSDGRIDASDPEAVKALMANFQAGLARLAKKGSKLPRSTRNPHRAADFDVADRLDKDLVEDGHRKWGWVIYRCTYDSEDEWQELLRSFKDSLKHELSFNNALDLLDSFELTIVDDRTAFENATINQLRKHFREWASSAPVREQGTGPALSQRYRFFVRVTKENLNSVLAIARMKKEEIGLAQGHFDLVDASHDLKGRHDGDGLGGFELVDGSRDYQVGWSRFSYRSYLFIYDRFRPEYSWDVSYVRPPQMMLS